MPPLSQAHPLIVHFPIALLLVVPLLVLLGLAWREHRAGIHIAALVLLVIGSSMAVLAVISGLAAAGSVRPDPNLRAVLEGHEQLAKRTTLFYAALTPIFILIQLAPARWKVWGSPRRILALNLLWLLASLGANALLIRTGHLGGRMVHELAIHPQPAGTAGAAASAQAD
ncbi:MAG: DUF2231 domain-containing protein [Holophagaceae bacterium]